MTEEEFAGIVSGTKNVVLSAVEKHLFHRFYFAVDDVVQETYLRAYNSLRKNRFRGDSALTTWLYAIARNESLRMNDKLHREEKKEKKLQVDYSGLEPEHLEETPDLSPWLKRLPNHYMDVIKLSLNGLSEKQIAAKLSISPGTVKSRSHRARAMLATLMKQENPSEV